jgi:polyhydroxyalkanoate synthesis repressor PhaR
MIQIKKYSNRRLYDTSESRYITLEELAEKIKAGAEVRVQDANTGADLTQATLAQIIMESRGAGRLFPAPLLTQMIRMGDDTLAEFLGQFLSVALGIYLQAKRGAQVVAPFYPLATAPFVATDMLARLLGGWPMGGGGPGPWGNGGAPYGQAPYGPGAQGGGYGFGPGQGGYAGAPPAYAPPPSAGGWGTVPPPPPGQAQAAPSAEEGGGSAAPQQSAPNAAQQTELVALRQELEALKKSLTKGAP